MKKRVFSQPKVLRVTRKIVARIKWSRLVITAMMVIGFAMIGVVMKGLVTTATSKIMRVNYKKFVVKKRKRRLILLISSLKNLNK